MLLSGKSSILSLLRSNFIETVSFLIIVLIVFFPLDDDILPVTETEFQDISMQEFIVSTRFYFFVIQQSSIGGLEVHDVGLDSFDELTLSESLLHKSELYDTMLTGY